MPIFDPFLDPPKTPKKPHFFEQIFGLFSCHIIKFAKSGGTQNAVGSQFIQVLSSVKWPFLGFLGHFWVFWRLYLTPIGFLLWRPPCQLALPYPVDCPGITWVIGGPERTRPCPLWEHKNLPSMPTLHEVPTALNSSVSRKPSIPKKRLSLL